MTESDTQKIIDGISAGLADHIREVVYEQTKSKDEEISALHREIRNDIKDLAGKMSEVKEVVDSHDSFISEMRDIVRTGGLLKKAFIWILMFVPSVAAFLAGIRYIYESFKRQ